MSVPDSPVIANIIQPVQNDKSSNLVTAGSVSSILINLPNVVSNSVSNYFDRHNELKLISSGATLNAPCIANLSSAMPSFSSSTANPTPRRGKTSQAKSGSATPAQMRYISSTSASAPLLPPRSPLVSLTSATLSHGFLPPVPATSVRQTMLLKPVVPSSPLPISQIPTSATTYISLNPTKPTVSKEETFWHGALAGNHVNHNMASKSAAQSAATTTVSPSPNKVVPIRPGPAVCHQSANLSMIRPILPALQNYTADATSHPSSAPPCSSLQPMSPPQLPLNCSPAAHPVRPMFGGMDTAGRFPPSNGVHQAAALPTLLPVTSAVVPSLVIPPVKLCAKPVSSQDKPAITKKRESITAKANKKPPISKAPAKSKIELPVLANLPAGAMKIPDIALNGFAKSCVHGVQAAYLKRPSETDCGAVKKKAKKKQTEEVAEKTNVVLPEPVALPVPVLPTFPVSSIEKPVTLAPVIATPPVEMDIAVDIKDMMCHELDLPVPATPTPSPLSQVNQPSSVAENGAFRKKTRLIFEGGIRKSQQQVGGNHENPVEMAMNPQASSSSGFEKSGGALMVSNINLVENDKDKKPKRTRKPRVERITATRLLKAKKPVAIKPMPTITRMVPVPLELKRQETEDQRANRMRRLANKWGSLSEDNIGWLATAKSVGQLKLFRWLRLVDRAFVQAESKKSFEKMDRARDSKIHSIMDLEKLQAPFEPRLIHLLHPDDLKRKDKLVQKFCSGGRLSKKELKWLTEHYGRLCDVEKTLPDLGASTDFIRRLRSHSEVVSEASTSKYSVLHPGNERGNFQAVTDLSDDAMAGSCSKILPPFVPDLLDQRIQETEEGPRLVGTSVQVAHQFIRKFPDSTKAMIELGPNGMPCAVLLLILQPNSKTVYIKKMLTEPEGGFASKTDSFTAATSLLNHLVVKYLCVPAFPIHFRYPLVFGCLNDKFHHLEGESDASRWNFNKDIHGWETVQFIDGAQLGLIMQDTVQDQDFDLANDVSVATDETCKSSVVKDYHTAYPTCLTDRDKTVEQLEKQITSQRHIDLTAMANDPVGQRRWLSWECRHLAQQYSYLDDCQQEREKWCAETIEMSGSLSEQTKMKTSRLAELVRDGLKRPKASTVLLNKTIRMGEQFKDVLDSYKKERPMTRRKKAAKCLS